MLARQQPIGDRKKKIRVAAFIRCGELCKSCGRTKCEFEPSEAHPLQVPCVHCDEIGCDQCDNKGFFEVKQCPKQFVGHRVSSASNLLSYLDKGILPEPGGLGDQPAWLVAAWDALQCDAQSIEEERRRRK